MSSIFKRNEWLREDIENYQKLLENSTEPPKLYDQKMSEILPEFEKLRKRLRVAVSIAIPAKTEWLEDDIRKHESFKVDFRKFKMDIVKVKGVFFSLPWRHRTSDMEEKIERIEEILQKFLFLMRVYTERIEVSTWFVKGLREVDEIVKKQNIWLDSLDYLPAAEENMQKQKLQLEDIADKSLKARLAVNELFSKMKSRAWNFAFRNHEVESICQKVNSSTSVFWSTFSKLVRLTRLFRTIDRFYSKYTITYRSTTIWLDGTEHVVKQLHDPKDLSPQQHQYCLDRFESGLKNMDLFRRVFGYMTTDAFEFFRDEKLYNKIVDEFSTSSPPKFHVTTAQVVSKQLEFLNRRFHQVRLLLNSRRYTAEMEIQNGKREKNSSDRSQNQKVGRIR